MNSLIIVVFTVTFSICSAVWNKAPVPVFLEDATDEAKEAFYQIIVNPNLSQEQKENAIEQFVQGQSQNIQVAFQVFKQKMEEVKNQFDQSIQQELNALSIDARNALAELNAIELDDKLSDEQKKQKVSSFFASLKQSVQEELKKLNPMVAGPLAGGNRIPHIGTGGGIGQAKKMR